MACTHMFRRFVYVFCTLLSFIQVISSQSLTELQLGDIFGRMLNGTYLNSTNPVRYDRLTRPYQGQGPVDIKVQYRVNRLDEVEPKTNSFALDIFLRLQWSDPRLIFNESIGSESIRVEPTDIWVPDVYFYNEQSKMDTLDYTLKIDNNGTCFWSRHFLMKFNSPFKLQEFPFDTQTLKIEAVSYANNEQLMNLHFYNESSGGPAFPDPSTTFSSVLWKLQSTVSNETKITFRQGQPRFDFLQYSLVVKRDPTNYIFKFILPLFFIAFASTLTYWIDPASAPARVSFAVSLLLSTIAFIFIVSSELPKVNYPTKLDVYIMVCFGFIFSALVEFAMVHYLNRYGYSFIGNSIEITSRIIFPLLLMLLTLAVFAEGNIDILSPGRISLVVLAVIIVATALAVTLHRIIKNRRKEKQMNKERDILPVVVA